MALADVLRKIFHALAGSYGRGVELLFADGAACDADISVGNAFEEDFGHDKGIMHRRCPRLSLESESTGEIH